MQSERQQPPSGICPIHCVGWYGNVVALRLLMNTGRVLIDYQDMYGNTALHYATFNGHEEFVKVCIEEFNANLLLVNNGDQSVLGVTTHSSHSCRMTTGPARWVLDAGGRKMHSQRPGRQKMMPHRLATPLLRRIRSHYRRSEP